LLNLLMKSWMNLEKITTFFRNGGFRFMANTKMSGISWLNGSKLISCIAIKSDGSFRSLDCIKCTKR